MSGEALLKVSGVSVSFTGNYRRSTFKAVNDVSFEISKGETLGLVGESGCGKTTLGRTIVRLQKEDCGNIFLNDINLCALTGAKLRTIRPQMQMIFQNPFSSLNPRMTALDIISEPFHRGISAHKRILQVSELMHQTGLDPEMMGKFPHEFSGGQRQRIAIARAIAANPHLIVADEPVSSLDVSVQAQILNILKSLRDKLSLTMLFISHDLSVVRYISQKVAVMYRGRIVEMGTTESIFKNPQHPYTRALLHAVPVVNPQKKLYNQQPLPTGDIEKQTTGGCAFWPRCSYAVESCKTITPLLQKADQSGEHFSACSRIPLPQFSSLAD